MDRLSKEQRSKIMSRIRSKWTGQEKKIHNYLKARKIRHKTHPNITGKPDLVLTDCKTAVFLHGCFWHKCPKHYKAPTSNIGYWLPKIERTVKRDKTNLNLLKNEGWRVVRIWEHEIQNNFEKSLEKICNGI